MVPPSFNDRLAEVIRRAATKLGPEAARQLRALLDPTALAITAGVIIVWLGSHAFGVGFAVDIVLGVVGLAAVGWAVFEGIDEFVEFAKLTRSARTETDLNKAADHLAPRHRYPGHTGRVGIADSRTG